MPSFPSNTDQLDEQLTAYLDGELPPTEARHVEDMLAVDERAQRRLNQLASSWDLLDQLPRAAVDEKFARTTVEMVALSTEEEIARVAALEPAKRRMRWLVAAVIALLAASFGFVAVSIVTPNNNEALLQNLPVIVNLDVYRPVGSVELLKKLNEANLFTTDFRTSSRGRSNDGRSVNRGDWRAEANFAPPAEPEKTMVLVPQSIEERRAWIEGNELNTEQKVELRRNFERFMALSTAEQASLRELDHELTTASDRDQLTNVMQRYNAFLNRLSLADRGVLEDLPVDQKIQEIEKRKLDREAQVLSGQRFTEFIKFVKQHETELLEKLPPHAQESLKKLKDQDRDSRQWRYYSHLAIEVVRHPEVMSGLIGESDLQAIIDSLPSDSPLKKELESTTDVEKRVEILSRWVKSGWFTQELAPRNRWPGGHRGFDEDRLKQLEAQLSPEERERIKELPINQRWMEIMRMLNRNPRGDRNQSFTEPRRGPENLPLEGPRFGGPRRGEDFRGKGPRGEGPRGEGPKGDRKGSFGRPPEFRPGENFDGPFPPPVGEKQRPEPRPDEKK